MCTTSILAVNNFTITFVLEGDVSRKGLGAVLMQDGRPLSFISKQLCHKSLDKSTYEKEMMVILHAVNTWQLYLIRWCFQIKLDHHNSEYFLEQMLSSLEKHKWVRKMLGYDYEIIYKKRKDNVVVEMKSRKHEEEGSLFSLSSPVPEWLKEAQHEWLINVSTS